MVSTSEFHPDIPIREEILGISEELLVVASQYFLEGLVFGGSYAAGLWQTSHDVDVDMIYDFCDLMEVAHFIQIIATAKFASEKLDLHVRTHVSRNGSLLTYSKISPFSLPVFDKVNYPELIYLVDHPNSPYVTRDLETVQFWNLSI